MLCYNILYIILYDIFYNIFTYKSPSKVNLIKLMQYTYTD